MTSKELRELRAGLKLKQGDVARFLGISPRTLHSLENSGEEIPSKYAEALESTLGTEHNGLSFVNKSLAMSDEFSWPAPAFEVLAETLGKMVRQVKCQVTIKPNKENGKKFGDVDYLVHYKGIDLVENKTILIDHIANPSGPGRRPASLEFVGDLNGPVTQVKIEGGARSLGSYAVAYMIAPPKGIRPVPDVSVRLASRGGVECNKPDGIGFPVYSDFLINLLIISVKFVNLIPEEPQASATLLRRTAYRYGYGQGNLDPVVSSSLDFKPATEGNQFTYGLIRPRGGMYFGLSWKRLQPSEAVTKNHLAT